MAMILDGKATAAEIRASVRASVEKDREKAGMTLPPQGLYLDEVFYE